MTLQCYGRNSGASDDVQQVLDGRKLLGKICDEVSARPSGSGGIASCRKPTEVRYGRQPATLARPGSTKLYRPW